MLENSLIQKLQTDHQKRNQSLNLGIYYKNTLVALCHALEDFVLESQTKCIIIAAFQLGKWYLEEADRYYQLAQKAEEIVIMAAPSTGFDLHKTSQLDNVSLVSLNPEDPVAQEWHLIIFSPTYTAMVLCQELSAKDYGNLGQPTEDLKRKFYGFWTFEPELVKQTVDLAIAHIGIYNPQLQQKLITQINSINQQFKQYQKDNLADVVSRVVNYLQNSQKDLVNPQNNKSLIFSQELDENLLSNEMQAFLRMAQFIDQADITNPNAANEVAALTEAMGQLLDLPAWQIKRLRLAGLLHRLLPFQVTSKLDNLKTPIQKEIVQQKDNLPKAFVLRIMPQLQAIAEIIIHQTEYWNGSGQPEGLAYDNIPLESRILGLLIYFQKQVIFHQQKSDETNALTQAYNDCQQLSGEAFDPKLIEALGLLIMAIKQGMNLPMNQPKIASGMWLLFFE